MGQHAQSGRSATPAQREAATVRTTEREEAEPAGEAERVSSYFFKIRDALQAEKREGEGSKRVCRENSLLGRRKCSAKSCPGLATTELRASAGRGASPPARQGLKPQAGRAGSGAAAALFICKSHSPFGRRGIRVVQQLQEAIKAHLRASRLRFATCKRRCY